MVNKKTTIILGMFLLMGIILLGGVNASTWTADLNTDIISYWKFDNTVTDELGLNNATGNLADYTASGKIAGAYDFEHSNSDYMTIPDSASLDLTDDLTINMWIKNEDKTLSSQGLLQKGSIAGSQGIYNLEQEASGGITFRLNGQTGNNTGSCASGSNTLTNGQWFMITATYSKTDGKQKIYQDGTLIAQCDYSTSISIDGNPLYIGTYYNSGYGFDGVIDEPSIWSKALTQTEITQLYNSGTGLTYIGRFDGYPTVTLNNPINNYNSTSQTINFNVTVTDDIKVKNVTLYINEIANETNSSYVNGTYYFTKILSEGKHNWSILAYDNNSASAQSLTRTLEIDITNPVITPTLKNFTYQQVLTDNQVINFTLTETNPDSCWYNYSGSNVAFNCSESGFYINLTQGNTDIYLYANDTFGRQGSYYMTWTETPTIITYNVLNYLGQLLSSARFTGDISYLGSQYTEFMSDRINETVNNVNLTIDIEDTSYYNRDESFTFNVNASQNVYNMTLNPNQLVLEFLNESTGVPVTTKFEIFDGEKSIANDSASILVIQQSLSEGNVYVRFNEDDYGTNWTQFYEYQNDYLTHITDNLTIIEEADWTVFFEIKSKDNRVIENAVLRAEFVKSVGGATTNVSLMGQRLTQTDGTTFFRFDSSSYATITVTAEGFDPKEILVTVGDESATSKSASYTIYLDESESGVSNSVWVGYPKWFTNRSANIEGMIMAKGVDQVKINTNYRSDLGLVARELTSDSRGRYDATLIAGQDFSKTATSDITVYIEVDGVSIKNWTIEEKTPTRVFDLPIDLDSEVVLVAGSIGLIFISGAIGMLFTSATAGFSAFMMGSILLSLISTSFLWLSLVSILYFVLKLIKRITGE